MFAQRPGNLFTEALPSRGQVNPIPRADGGGNGGVAAVYDQEGKGRPVSQMESQIGGAKSQGPGDDKIEGI